MRRARGYWRRRIEQDLDPTIYGIAPWEAVQLYARLHYLDRDDLRALMVGLVEKGWAWDCTITCIGAGLLYRSEPG